MQCQDLRERVRQTDTNYTLFLYMFGTEAYHMHRTGSHDVFQQPFFDHLLDDCLQFVTLLTHIQQ